jgi:hypothetical protein
VHPTAGTAHVPLDARLWQSDIARTRLFAPSTIMNVVSISEASNGVALMRAVQDGTLSLDVDINRCLPFRVENPHRLFRRGPICEHVSERGRRARSGGHAGRGT